MCKYYNYHARIRDRINRGELLGYVRTNRAGFAIVLIFNTPPFERPIRLHAAGLYDKEIMNYKEIKNGTKNN